MPTVAPTAPTTTSAVPAGVPAPRSADDTAQKLVDAAVKVFAEKGYEGAGVAEIARRAGLTTGAIYSRFSGKADLLLAAIHTSTGHELDTLFASHAFEGRAPDLLRTVGVHLVTRRPEPGRALLLEAFVAARHHPEVAALLRDHLAERATRLAGMVDESKAQGLVAADVDTTSMVQFAHAVGLGFLLFEAVDVPNPDAPAWEALITRVLSSVSPLPSSPTAPTTQE